MIDPLKHLLKKVKGQAERIDKLAGRPSVWEDGTYAVVTGPFPNNFPRCMAFRDKRKAVECDPLDDERGLVARPGIGPKSDTGETYYAKVLKASIQDNHNDWGEVAP